jgi:hypothetical protein
MMTEVVNQAHGQTSLTSDQADETTAVLAAYSTAAGHKVYALFGQAASTNGYGSYSYNSAAGVGAYGRAPEQGVGVVGSTGPDEPPKFASVGVAGYAHAGYGVFGLGAHDATGVYGITEGSGPGVYGKSAFGTGVVGETGGGTAVSGTATTGNGVLAVAGVGRAVYARTTGGVAVNALATEGAMSIHMGAAVHAYADIGTAPIGVIGDSTGVGVQARSAAGIALESRGKVRFSRSGRGSIPKNSTYLDVSLAKNGGVGATALCFANLLTPRTGVYVRAVKPNATSGTIRIYLNKVASTTASTPVAWMVLENPG